MAPEGAEGRRRLVDEEECEAFNSTTVMQVYVWWPPTVDTSEIVKGYRFPLRPLTESEAITRTAE